MAERPTEYADIQKAAVAVLDAFSAYAPPQYVEVYVKRQGQIVTSGALQNALVMLAREKYPKIRVDGADVGLKWPDEFGAAFTIEGVWKAP